MSDAITVVLVDDHPVFRLGLAAVIEGLDGIEVTGEAATAAEAVALVESVRPDVVVMDVQLPDASGIEATALLLKARPDLGVLVLTMFDDDDSVHAAMRVGARGYLVKGVGAGEIERAIRAVAHGEIILGAAAARRAQLNWRGGGGRFPELTDREREVLELVAQGLGNQAIARRLVLNEKTIRNHISNLLTKIGAATRAEAIAKARDAGLGDS
ncbi:MAG TPA: response regulator transcription factor [Acidimicrobiales bacterium]|nr:response regulator transcription factor [Acidimicrobiales bacterium]